MKSDAELSDLALANVEAPARNENGDNRTYQIGEKTISQEVYESISAGWSWDIGASIWIFNGKVTRNWPPEYRKKTVMVKIKCCREFGDEQSCNYEVC